MRLLFSEKAAVVCAETRSRGGAGTVPPGGAGAAFVDAREAESVVECASEEFLAGEFRMMAKHTQQHLDAIRR